MSLDVWNGREWTKFYTNGMSKISDIPKLRTTSPELTVEMVNIIQADGDELEYIKQRFANIPIAHGICIWRGDMAKFIWENLE